MIGRVHFETGGQKAVATLGDDRQWTVVVDGERDEVLTFDLNVNHSLAGYSPSDGQPGYLQLHNVAREYGGTVDAPPVPPTADGLLY